MISRNFDVLRAGTAKKSSSLNLVFALFIFLLASSNTYSQSDSTYLDSVSFSTVEDNAYLKAIDSIISQQYANAFLYADTTFKPEDSAYTSLVLDDSLVASQILLLDSLSPFALSTNKHVMAFIRLYLGKKKDVTQRILGLAPYYFPIFEERLDAAGLPLELKYLPIVESALNPKARSRAGAMGLWQFMYRTGKMYDLQVNSYYDERMDPLKATDAACQYLGDLYKMYEDWNLVIAAYNCGPGNVNKAIRRSGGHRDYWKIWNWLPRETRGYVPAFIAVNYAMSYHEDYDVYPELPEVSMTLTDTVQVQPPLSFEAISKGAGVPINWISYYNPMYRLEAINGQTNKMSLVLPNNAIGAFLSNIDSIYAADERLKSKPEVLAKVQPKPGQMVVHRVRSGEVLGVIAERYHCRVSEIKDWNNLWSSRIYPGQKLTIYTNSPPSPTVAKRKTARPVEKISGKFRYYTIRPGDTLWDIAKKYESVTVTDLKRLNRDLNFKKLKPGDKIRVSKVG